MRFLFILVLFISTNAFSKNKFRSHGENLEKGGFEFSSFNSIYSSSGIFDEDGEKVPYVSGEKYTRMESLISGAMSITNNLQVQLKAAYRINQSTQFDGTSNKSQNIAGIHHIGANFNLMFQPTDNLIGSLEGEYRKRMYDNPLFDNGDPYNFIVLGNEDAYVHLGGNLTYLFSEKFVVGAKGLFRNIGTNLSNDILIDLLMAFERESFTFFLGTKRTVSLKSEKYETQAEKPSLGNGATALYNGVNQEFGSIYAGLEFYIKENWTLGLGLENIYYAKSFDTGNKIFGELKYTFGDKSKNHHEHVFKTYSIEGRVLEVSKDNSNVMINMGLAKAVEEGMRIDFYHGNQSGGQRLIATGYVTKIYTDQSEVSIKKYFRREKLDETTIVRADH